LPGVAVVAVVAVVAGVDRVWCGGCAEAKEHPGGHPQHRGTGQRGRGDEDRDQPPEPGCGAGVLGDGFAQGP
jgi:hypothetical protein